MKVLAVCALSAALSLSAWAAGRRTYPLNVPAAGVQSVRFDVQQGDFVLRGDPSVSQIEMHVSIDRFYLFKLGEENILKKLIKISGEGTPELTVSTALDPSWKNWGRAEYPIDFEIVVPPTLKINVRDTSGKIVISGMNAAVDVTDTSGTLTARNLRGALKVNKDSGDILIDDIAGPTWIASHSGQMHLRQVGELTIESSEGNIDLTGAQSVHITNRSGNVRISEVARTVDIEDDSGEIVLSAIDGEASVADTSGNIRARRTGALKIHDTSGDISVDTAPAVHVLAKQSGQVRVKNVAGDVDVPKGITLKRE